MVLQCNNVFEIFDFDQIICLYIRSSEAPIHQEHFTQWTHLLDYHVLMCYGKNNNIYSFHWELSLLLEGAMYLKMIFSPKTYKTLGAMCVFLSTLKHIELTTLCSWLVCSRPRSPKLVFQTMSILPMSVTPFMTLFCFMTSGLGTKQ